MQHLFHYQYFAIFLWICYSLLRLRHHVLVVVVVKGRGLIGGARVERSRCASGCIELLAYLLDIVRGEYVEMPGLRLSRRQAQRLWAIDAETCDAVLGALEHSHFLERNEADEFMRAERS